MAFEETVLLGAPRKQIIQHRKFSIKSKEFPTRFRCSKLQLPLKNPKNLNFVIKFSWKFIIFPRRAHHSSAFMKNLKGVESVCCCIIVSLVHYFSFPWDSWAPRGEQTLFRSVFIFTQHREKLNVFISYSLTKLFWIKFYCMFKWLTT